MASRIFATVLLACGLAMGVASNAAAEASARQLLTMLQNESAARQAALFALNNLSAGFTWANVRLGANGQPKLYCIPQNLALADEQLADILRRHVDQRPHYGEAPYGMALLDAITEIFPCPAAPAARR